MSELILEFPTGGKDVGSVHIRLVSELKRRGFGVLAELKLDEIIKSKTGDEVQPSVVLEVCKPSFAADALKRESGAAALMPCRISIFQRQGKVHVSLMSPTALATAVSEEIYGIAKDAENELVDSVRSLAGDING